MEPNEIDGVVARRARALGLPALDSDEMAEVVRDLADPRLARGPTPHPAGAWGVVRGFGDEIVGRYHLRSDARAAAHLGGRGLKVVRVDERVSGRMSLRRVEATAASTATPRALAAVAPVAPAPPPPDPPVATSLPRIVWEFGGARVVEDECLGLVVEIRREDTMGAPSWRVVEDAEGRAKLLAEALSHVTRPAPRLAVAR